MSWLQHRSSHSSLEQPFVFHRLLNKMLQNPTLSYHGHCTTPFLGTTRTRDGSTHSEGKKKTKPQTKTMRLKQNPLTFFLQSWSMILTYFLKIINIFWKGSTRLLPKFCDCFGVFFDSHRNHPRFGYISKSYWNTALLETGLKIFQ